MGDLRSSLEDLRKLNRNRFDYVIARSHSKTRDEALKECNLSTGWYYRFTEDERKELEAISADLHYEQKIQAEMILQNSVNRAAQIKVEGLDSRDSRVKQDCATEILDRVLGKANQPISGKNGGPIELDLVSDTENVISKLLPKPTGE